MEGEDGEEWQKVLCKDRIAHKGPVALDLRKGRCKQWMPGLFPHKLFMAKPTPVTYKL